MKNYALLLLLAIGSNSAFAQMGYGKPEDIKEVQQKTLLVVLDAPKDKESKKLSKSKADLADYEKEIADYNTALREVFATEWKMSKDVKFVTEEEFEAIIDDKVKKTQYAYFENVVNRSTVLNRDSGGGVDRIPRTYSHILGLTDQGKPVYTMMYNTLHPNKGDLVFIVQQFQNYFKMRLEDKGMKEMMKELLASSPQLKNMTLLIDADLIDDKAAAKIAEVYKYKYIITPKSEIDNAIVAHKPGIAYIRLIPVAQMVDRPLTQRKSFEAPAVTTSQMIFTQYIVNAEDGQGISFVSGATGSKTTFADLKTLMKNIDGK